MDKIVLAVGSNKSLPTLLLFSVVEHPSYQQRKPAKDVLNHSMGG